MNVTYEDTKIPLMKMYVVRTKEDNGISTTFNENCSLKKLEMQECKNMIYRKMTFVIAILCLIVLIIIANTTRIIDAAVNSNVEDKQSTDSSDNQMYDFLNDQKLPRNKRDINSNHTCNENYMSKCEQVLDLLSKIDPQDFKERLTPNVTAEITLCLICMKNNNNTKYETTLQPAANEIKKSYSRNLATVRNMTGNRVRQETTESSLVESIVAGNNGMETTTKDNRNEEKGEQKKKDNSNAPTRISLVTDDDTDVNGEGRLNVTKISNSMETSNNARSRAEQAGLDYLHSRFFASGSKNDYDSSDSQAKSVETMPKGESMKSAQTLQFNQIMSPFPCYFLNGVIQPADFGSITAQNSGAYFHSTSLPFETSDGKSNTPYRFPLLCTLLNPQGYPVANKNFGSESQMSAFRLSNSGIPVDIAPSTSLNCSSNAVSCDDKSQCILKWKLCDGNVDCPDASDESKCNCKSRIPSTRICDGYFDCPLGEDELGCHGCDTNSFKCDEFDRSYRTDNCVPITQRCDNIKQCPNGRDEEDCSILTNDDKITTVGYISGFLHRNYKGEWYPVRSSNKTWIMNACQLDTGVKQISTPSIEIKSYPNHKESCINANKNDSIEIVTECEDITYVECHEMQCGTRLISYKEEQETLDYDPRGNINDIVNAKNELVGIVGGQSSAPKAWPFLAIIFQDGNFHCGGTIIDKKWILSAAHCFFGQKSYYEIRVGLLRKRSYSPTMQIRKAKAIFLHPKFDMKSMQNDIALILLSEDLQFNRWVRPICVPSNKNRSFIDGPKVGTECKVMGWGIISENGLEADNLKEVSVPITKECIRDEDKHEGTICAGFKEGGKDACSGDSGGPLLCMSKDSRWYIAGVISHGVGCAEPNEVGVYTRVKTYSDWIEDTINNPFDLDNGILITNKCPGFLCKNPPDLCLLPEQRCNKIVDCLDTEDELNCEQYRSESIDRKKIEKTQTSDGCIHNKDISDNIIEDSEKPYQQLNKSAESRKIVTSDTDAHATLGPENTMPEYSSTSSTSNLNVTEYPITTENNEGPIKVRLNQTFICKRIPQLVSLEDRCNHVFDCEDGTDEENCMGIDYLRSLYPELLCNGHYDCADKTDEDEAICGDCTEKGFMCFKTGVCIKAELRCNEKEDCPHGEDESDCFALTNGQTMFIDYDHRPRLQVSGIVSEFNNGEWVTVCLPNDHALSEAEITTVGKSICKNIGFSNVNHIDMVSVNRRIPLSVIMTDINRVNSKYNSKDLTSTDNSKDTCTGMHLTCDPTLDSPSIEFIDYPVPWQAAVYVEGQFICTAIILDENWLLAAYDLLKNVDVQTNYTVAMLGLSPSYKIVDGPYQQLIRVDGLSVISDKGTILLHLKEPVNMTRYIQPIFTKHMIFPPTNNEQCIALADNPFESRMFVIESTVDNCPLCSRCFLSKNLEEDKSDSEELSETTWSGTVSCLGSGGWYLAAVFNNKTMSEFQSKQTLTSIDVIAAHIFKAMDEHSVMESEIECNGVRCSLGNCIPMSKVCNEVQECRDGSDELLSYCRAANEFRSLNSENVECKHSEIRCKNGRCVDKSDFCDGSNDCGDYSDEPSTCNCASYLALTEPERNCDGKRDCFDKSDEDPSICDCERGRTCLGSNQQNACIIQDYICDEEYDCEDRSDESICVTLVSIDRSNPSIKKIMQKSFGISYTYCFDEPVTEEIATHYCMQIGFKKGNVTEIEKEPPKLVPVMDQFFIIILNDRVKISLRRDKPIIELVEPTYTCYQAIVTCI